jgi:RimJ/RimL family protein N-acetyltransferase
LAGGVPAAKDVVDPPEVINAGELMLRRAVVDDADALAQAVLESLEHLRPWMPWATPEAATATAQRDRLARATWGPDDYGYLMVADSSDIVGGCGLHRRLGPRALEIGYWVHVEHLRRGHAKAAAGALTRAALAVPGVERVEIHCDQANIASSAVPARLGYRLDRLEDHPIDSPAQTGKFMIWVTDAAGMGSAHPQG